MSWIVGSAVAYVAMLLIQPFLVQVSVALTGEPAPRFGRALGAWLVGTILVLVASFGFSFTLGWMVPKVAMWVVNVLLTLGVFTVVFKRQFGTTLVQGLAVAVVYALLGSLLSSVTWYFLG